MHQNNNVVVGLLLTPTTLMFPESRQLHRVGKSSGHSCNPSFDVIVVMRIPIVALIRADGSPILFRHSCFMNVRTSLGNF